jgi:tetratricopeptide (TPR) repeat protein
MRENKIHPINNWNYTHNLDYLVANSAEQGRYKEAETYARMLGEVEGSDQRLKATGLGYLLYGGHTALTRLHMRFAKWDEAIASLAELPDASPAATYRRGILGYLKGMRAVAANDSTSAETALAQLQKAAEELAAARSPNASDWYAGHAGRVLAVHALDLHGSLASIRGEHSEAEKLLNEAVMKERDLGYWEPPHYTRPVLESLGEALIRARRFAEAKNAFELILTTRPNSGFAYIGIARSAAAAGDTNGTNEAKKKLLAVWQNADKDLSEIKAASN